MIKTGKIIVCQGCEKEFYASGWEIKDGKKFCSYDCYWKNLKGQKPKTDNTGKTPWNKGKKFDGIGYGNWQGGKTSGLMKARNSEEYIVWRKSVFERDNYLCQMCKNPKSRPLQAHHIFPFNNFVKFRFRIDNGITLCKKCHEKIKHQKLFAFTNKHKDLINSYLTL